MVDNISGTEWRLKSFIEVREGENRAGGPPCIENVLHGANIVARFTEMSVSGTAGSMEYSHDNLNLSVVRPGESVADGSDDKDTDLPRGRCPGEDSEKADVRDVAGQAERYLELLTQLRRYMIFGDRLVVLTDSQQALLFQADGCRDDFALMKQWDCPNEARSRHIIQGLSRTHAANCGCLGGGHGLMAPAYGAN